MTNFFGPRGDPMGEAFDRKVLAVKVGSRLIGSRFPTYVIAEIGINHNGSLEKAKALVDVAAEAGCDAVKLQKRKLTDLYTREVLENPNRYEEGFQYFIPILKETEFEREQYDELVPYSRSKGLEFLCTAFDEASVDFLDSYHLPAYKVASADFTNFILLQKLAEKKKPLLLSTGMATQEEIDKVASFLLKRNILYALLHCVSAYPAPPEDAHLNFIQTMRERYGVPVGYSGHEVGFEVTLAAVAAGACLIERHITLDRRMEGPDHTSSLEPEELKQMVRRIRLIDRAMGSSFKVLSRGVIRTQEILSKSLVATQKIDAGMQVQRQMVTAKAPGKGLSPFYLYELIGRKIRRTIHEGEFFKPEDLEDAEISRKVPSFETRWGFKGRFHDLDSYLKFDPKLVEIHLNDRDLEYPFEEAHGEKKYPYQLFLHCPTYWYRSVLNLASEDEAQRQEHIRVAQRVIDMARRLSPRFAGKPTVIIHLGGMDIVQIKEVDRLKELTYRSMKSLNWDGVNFLPENMPPRPWYFSGQWFDNIFCSAEEMLEVSKLFGLKICLDLSHAKLYTNYSGTDYWEYLRNLAPVTSHLHVADAYGLDGEGVQIGEGEVDFAKAFAILESHGDMGSMSWTPEIWQGHLHHNQGFLTALERLGKIPQLKPIWPKHGEGNGNGV